MSEEANNNHADLLRELFQAAIQLRGSVEPSDYKRYVLPLVFLRFLSLRFDQRREEIQGLEFVYEPQKLRFFQGRFEAK